MSGPKLPINPSNGKKDWDYTPPSNKNINVTNEEEDDDDFDEDEGHTSDPYEGREHEEPFC